MKKVYKKIVIALLFIGLFYNPVVNNVFAIEENPNSSNVKTKSSWLWFKRSKKQNSDEKQSTKEKENQTTANNSQKKIKIKTKKKSKVEDIKLPAIVQNNSKIPFNQLNVMSIEDCVDYALAHNPNLQISEQKIKEAKAGIGIARSNYAPKLTGKVNYNHTSTHNSEANNNNNAGGFNVGISDMIWDFGKTTASINVAKYDTISAEYDHEYEELVVIYKVKINYYKVLSALANLDIYEQNVRINTLNYERTKAMFDEGLKSKIDVVNAEVNLTESKIQLVEGQNTLETALINLQNAMYYQEDTPFIVKNTENFNFLKVDYKKKIESIITVNPQGLGFKKANNGMIMLTSGIEHKDIIQNFEFKPLTISKQEAVNQALEFRPDLKSHKMLTLLQEETLKSIKKEYAPEINAELTWGYTKNTNNYTSPLSVGASVGLGSVNPYRIHYKIKEGESLLDIAYHNLNIAKADVFWEVQANYVNMRQLERKIPLMNSKVKATLENFELADGRYSVGLSNYVELQDALVNYNKAQLSYVEAVFGYNVARETLLKSMGVR